MVRDDCNCCSAGMFVDASSKIRHNFRVSIKEPCTPRCSQLDESRCGNSVCEAAGVTNNRLPWRSTSLRQYVILRAFSHIHSLTNGHRNHHHWHHSIWDESQIHAVVRDHLAGASVGTETPIHLSRGMSFSVPLDVI